MMGVTPPEEHSGGRLEHRWGVAWILMALAIGLHVGDEALNDFLPLYNSSVEWIRDSYGIAPPRFSFGQWLGGLLVGVALLLALSPLVFAAYPGFRALSYGLGVLMVANACGHVGASIYLGAPAPGVYSSPILLAAAVYLLYCARAAGRSGAGRGAKR
jgi:hypothetical protein